MTSPVTHLLHLGLTVEREQPLTADEIGPEFHTDGDSFTEWCEKFDGTQRVTVPLAGMPEDPTAFADDARQALLALVALRDLPATVESWGSFTEGHAEAEWSEWEVPVRFEAPAVETYRLPDPDAPCVECGEMVMDEMACPNFKRECVDCCPCEDH